ncbi:unnamed protein product [Trichobilharzia regenti]|nr:unnamed protein product [Trichobilharzia regenti]
MASLLKPEELKAMAEKNLASDTHNIEAQHAGTDLNQPEEQSSNVVTSPKRKSSNFSVHFTGEHSDQQGSTSQNNSRNKHDVSRRRSNKGPLPPVD